MGKNTRKPKINGEPVVTARFECGWHDPVLRGPLRRGKVAVAHEQARKDWENHNRAEHNHKLEELEDLD